MIPHPAAFARVTNSGSTYLKENSAIAGMLERKTSTAAPAGEMSSVDILSPSFSSTGASSASATGSPSGTDLIFGPRMTSPLPSGMTSPALEVAKLSGRYGAAGVPAARGSVIVPVSAEAAAVTDEHR